MHRQYQSWRERVVGCEELPSLIRYTRKSTEESDRQATSHEQQNVECDRKWGAIDPRWSWRDSFTGTTFNRPDFQDMVDFCRANPRPRSRVGFVEMYAPSRFGRILDETGRPDLNAYMLMYLELERSGWQLRFVTIDLTGNPTIDYVLIAIHATEAANYATNLSKDVSRGLRNASREGWWTHAIPPFGTRRFDTRSNKVLGPGEASTGGAGGVVLVADPPLLEAWEYAARRLIAGDSLEAIGGALYDRGIRGRHGGSLGHRHVRNILSNPALIGENQFTDRDRDGNPVLARVQARWPALVDSKLFRDVETELQRRSENPRNRKRKARGSFPLRPICIHCGLEYNGSRLSKAQDEVRSYVHPIPSRRVNPEAYELFHAQGCRAYTVLADELENAIRDTILAERATSSYEADIRAFLLEREGFRKTMEQSLDAARDEVRLAKAKLDKMLRAITLTTDSDINESEFKLQVEPLRQDLKAAKRRLSDAQALVDSRSDAWSTIESILDETRNLASAWDLATADDRKALLDYWVLDVWIAVERIEGKRRANEKTAIVTLAVAPSLVRPPVKALATTRQHVSAALISSLTQASSSSTSRRTSTPPTSATTSSGVPGAAATRPRAHAACPRTSGSSSSSASLSAGTASGEAQLPSATAMFRRNPRRLARFTGEPLNRAENSSCVSDINSVSGAPWTPGRGWNAGSVAGVENLWLNGQTSWQMSQP